ncbi:Acetyl esterase/lipase [Enhydrobacter aerosaccus]|uniref:Acetyl esterase/lipase n=1 Tax=Enhydrobacter aerosaccus TaxID=225324 RepID=A0A1T4K9J1_9HYPH|nr:alpha/beta hydrolase [Enhydrobacter aerosaccus]SJZ39118.1 Acetyl esterase/lipase [Enhydrobacter aerosaccus]
MSPDVSTVDTSAAATDALRAALAEIGPRWASDIAFYSQRTKDAYDPVLARAPKADIAVTRDVAYGDHARQVLDIFRPVDAKTAPVVVFVHGGAFVRGAKRTTDELYDNVLYWFARQGFVGVNIEYRLAPEAAYPAGAHDLALALDWVQRHIGSHGGNPGRVLLIGHSAGGTHVASYACDPALGYLGRHVSAVVLISARLRADQSPVNPNAMGVRAYFGDDSSLYDIRSPVSHATHCHLPVLVAAAEFENPLLDVYALEFAHRLAQARGRAPRFVQMKGHNHMSIVAHFNTEEETLGRIILDFFDQEGRA